ncbi:MAG TPA: hypothetical protein VGM77_09610 [Gemmatimonadales bacterium]|jgi:hypothetical protein
MRYLTPTLLLASVVAAPLAAQQSGAVLPTAAAVPAEYVGNCPARIAFIGRVTVTIPGTRIDYRWVRSNGDSGKILHAQIGKPRAAGDTATGNFTGALPADVWHVALPLQTGRFWEVLHILSPFDIASGRAVVAVDCR